MSGFGMEVGKGALGFGFTLVSVILTYVFVCPGTGPFT